MKLHLPKLLRNSVLACITAVAGIATTTVGTATFAGGAVAFVLAGQQANAETTTLTEADSTYTFSAGNDVVVDVGADNFATINIDTAGTIHVDKTGEDDTDGFLSITSGKVKLNVSGEGTIAVLDHGDDRNSFLKGGSIEVSNGATLVMSNFDTIGWSTVQSPNPLTLTDAEWHIAGRQSTFIPINLNGNTVVKATDNAVYPHVNGQPPSLHCMTGAAVNATGTSNLIDSSLTFYVDNNMSVNVAASGDLEIAARVMTHTGTGGVLSKTGDGTVRFTNAGSDVNTFFAAYNQQAGTSVFTSTGVDFRKGINISGGTLTVEAGTPMTLGGTIAMTGGTLNLNSAITVSSLANFAYTDELSGTQNGLTDYSVTYHLLTGGTNSGTTTKVTYGGAEYNLADGITSTLQCYLIAEGTVNVGGDSPAADTAGATRFHINEGATMNLGSREEGAALSTIDAVVSKTSGTGTIVLSADANIGPNGGAYDFAGTISVQGGTLKLGNAAAYGANGMQEVDLSNATISLDGGSLRYFGGNSTVGEVIYNNAASAFAIYATNTDGREGTLTVNKLNIADGLTMNVGVTWTHNMHINELAGTGTFVSRDSSGKIYTIDAVSGYGRVTNDNAVMTLGKDAESELKLGGTIINNGTLTVNGKVSISDNLDGFTVVTPGTYSDELSVNGTDGYQTMVGATYLLMDNNVGEGESLTWNAGTTVSYNGGTINLTTDEATGDITFVGASTYATIYHVNTADIVYGGENATENTGRATGFAIADGRKVTIAGAASTAAAGELLFNTTGSGTIEILTNTTMHGTNARADGSTPRATQFTGIISVKDGTLNIADEGSSPNKKSVDLRSVKAIQMDGGNIRFHGADSYIGKVVINQAGTFSFQEADASVRKENGLSIDEIALNADLAFNGTWGTNFAIAKLTGTGDISIAKGAYGDMSGSIGAIEGCGALTNNGVALTIGTDANSALNLGGTITNTNHANTNLTINGKVAITGELDKYTLLQRGTLSETMDKNGGTDGYKTLYSGTYLLLDNQGAADKVTWNAGTTASYNGATVTLTKDAATGDISFEGSGTSLDTIYYVNTVDITIGGDNATEDTARATGFAVAAGRKVTFAAVADTVVDANSILNSSGTGTIELLGNTSVGSVSGASEFAGTISVKGGTLQLGSPGNSADVMAEGQNNMQEIDLSEATISMDGGNVRFSGGNSTIGTVKADADGGVFRVHATNKGADNPGMLTVKNFNVAKDVTQAITARWEINMTIDALTGEGRTSLEGGAAKKYYVNSITNYGSVTNLATLELGQDEQSQLKLGGSIISNGTLTVNGKVSISDDISRFAVASEGILEDTLSKGTDGYKKVAGSTYYLLDNQAAAGSVTWNAGDTASYNGTEIELTRNAETGDITFVGGSSWTTTYYVNTEDITIGGDNATEDTGRATALAIADGRTVTIAGSADAATLLKNTTGGATTRVVVDTAAESVHYVNADLNVTGTLEIQSGRVVHGEANINGSGANKNINIAKLIIGADGEFTTNYAQKPKTLGFGIDMMSGAVLSNVDGNVKYNGGIRFNVVDPDAAEASYDSNGVVTIDPYWGKNIRFSSVVAGAGTVKLHNTRRNDETYDYNVNYYLESPEANTFTGTYELCESGTGVNAADTINLYVENATALNGASVKMTSTTAKAHLYLGANAELVSLDGVAGAGNTVKANAAAVTLTVSKGDFGGRLENNGENVLSLTKKGTDTLTLGGTIAYTGATTVQGGTLAFTGTGALTLGSISTVGSAQITTASALTLAAGSALTMDLAGATTANALIGVGAGTFSITDATCALTLSNADSLEDGEYKLISWAEANSALTLDKFNITGVELGKEYALKIEGNALILSKTGAATLSWDVNNDTWAVGSAFAPAGSEKVNFEDKDAAVFSGVVSGTTSEAVAIKGTVNAKSVTITPGEGNTYTFTTHADGGQLVTSKLAIGAGTVSFGTDSLNLETTFTEVSVADKGVLDLSALSTKKVFTEFAGVAAGDGTVKLSGGNSFDNGVEHRIDMRELGTGGETTTAVKYEVASGMAINAWVDAGSAAANTLNIAKDFTVGGELRLESNAVVNVTGGTLTAGTIGLGHSTGNDTVELKVSTGGTVKAGSIANTAAGTHKVTMTGGTLELTGEGGIAAGITTDIQGGKLVANTADWGVTGATISGGVEIAGANTITLTDAQLKGTLTNNGKLALAGTINIAPSADFQTQVAGEQFSGEDGNGFKFADVTYTLASGSGTISVADVTAWQLDGTAATNATYAEGKLNVKGAQQGTLYWANTGTVTYGAEGIAGATGIALNGGSVALNASLADTMTAGLDVKAAGTVTLGDGAELAASQVNGATADNKVTLNGTGIYDLGSSIVLGESVGLADSWQGTVETAVSSITTDTTLALGDKVEFTAETLTLGGILTAGDSTALTMNALSFSSVGDSEGAARLTGSSLTLDSIAVTSDALSGLTTGTWTLVDVDTLTGVTAIDEIAGAGENNLYKYTFKVENGVVTMTGELNGLVWGTDDDDFGADAEQSWDSSTTASDTNVVFNGKCSSTDDTSAGKVNVDSDGVVVNDVTITQDSTLADAQEEYTLTGGDINAEGTLTVLEGTALTVENNSTFKAGVEVNEGSLTVGETGSLTVGTDTTAADMKVDADNGSLTVSAGSSVTVTGKLSVDTIEVAKLDSAKDVMIFANEIAAATDGGKITIDLVDDIVDSVGTGTYSLIKYATGAEIVLDNTDEQAILKKGYWVTMGETSTFALRNATTTYGMNISDEDVTWNVGDTSADNRLVVLDGTALKGNDILDNVDIVKVKGSKSISLEGDALSSVKLNKLTADGAGAILALTGDDAAIDKATISSAADGYKGTLKLNKLKADLGTAVAPVKGATVVVEGDTVVLNGALEDGTLVVDKGANLTGNSLTLTNSALGIDIGTAGNTLTQAAVDEIMEKGLATVDGVTTDDAFNITIGTYSDEAGFQASAAYDKYFTNAHLENGVVVVERNESYYSDNYAAQSANGQAGMQLADAALLELNPQAGSDLATVLNAIENATSAGQVDELGASLAGASTAVLGMAVSGDVDRQLQAIRNRTTTMGVDQSVVNAEMPYFNAWINAEGDRSELSESGTESGYELSSWGGTVGFDVDLCPTFTAGMALTAMYGDIDTTGADKASGNIDTYYVTAFARYAPSAWTHTFVATVGMSDISLDRHVAGAEVEGETDGLSFGLMYEVGRVFALTEDGSTCLQPVFNVTWKHTAIDAYTEDGSDLALEVDEQTLDTVTFGLGARLQTVVGESMYNRTSILEARVLAKADVGDRSGSADVALSALPGTKASVDSAEMGAFGLEAGAGLTIPVGDEGGSIFMDASVELRSDYTNVNGTVGYRINF